MSLVNFLKSDLVKNKVLKLIGKDYSVAGIFLYADEDFVVLKGKDGRLHGIRIALVDVINTSGDLSPEISDKDTAGDVSFGDTDNDTDFSSEEQAGDGVEDQNEAVPAASRNSSRATGFRSKNWLNATQKWQTRGKGRSGNSS